MEKLSAQTGWLWVKQGFAFFRQQPGELSTLFMGYMLVMFTLGMIPVLGQLLPLILVPAFSMAFMLACMTIEQGQRAHPRLLFAGFRSPALPTLLKLGGLNLLTAVLAVGASSLIDGGVFWQVMSGQIELDPKTVQESDMSLAMLFSAALYTPAAMAFWYAAPLAFWQKMGIGKAIFYSFFAVKRAGKAFLIYGLSWLAIGVLLPTVISLFITLLLGKSLLATMLLIPMSVALTIVLYCSFYPTYTAVFGQPASETPPVKQENGEA